MKKKIAVLIYPGLEYKKAILYARDSAQILGTDIHLIGVIPELNNSERVSLSINEYGIYGDITQKMEKEVMAFFDTAYQFCKENNISVVRVIQKGHIEEVIETLKQSEDIRLVVVSTLTKSVNYLDAVSSVRKLAKHLIPNTGTCPVISVL